MGSLYLVLCAWFLLVVNTSASDCLERLVSEMIYYVSRGTLMPLFFHNSCSENHCLCHIFIVNEKTGTVRLCTRGHDFTLPFVKYNLVRRILSSEPCTIIFRMCSSGLSDSVSQCALNVLNFHNFFHWSACAFDMCLLNYLLTYCV